MPVAPRVVGLALGYEELNDRDPLCHVPVPRLLAEQREGTPRDCAALSVTGATPNDTRRASRVHYPIAGPVAGR